MAFSIAEAFVQITAKFGGLTKELAAAQDELAKAMVQMGKTVRKFGDEVIAVGASLSLKFTAPITAGFALASNEMIKFEERMRSVNVIARQTEEQFARTSEEVLNLAVELGKKPTELAEALFTINSAGFKGADAMKVLRESTIAGAAGLSDTATAAKGIAAVLNAYGLSARNAADVSDILFKTNELGVLTFEELSNELGKIVSTSAAASVKFEEVAAAIAAMTQQGIQTNEAVTALNRLMLAFIDPSDEMKKALRRITAESGATIIATRGLKGAIEILNQITAGSPELLTEMGLEMRSLKAALALTGESSDLFATALDQIANPANRAGAAAAAFEEQAKSLAFQLGQTRAAITKLSIEMGQILSPAVRLLAQAIEGLATSFSGMPQIIKVVTVVLIAFVAVIPLMIISMGLFTKTLGLAITVLGIYLFAANSSVIISNVFALATGRTTIALIAQKIQLKAVAIATGLQSIAQKALTTATVTSTIVRKAATVALAIHSAVTKEYILTLGLAESGTIGLTFATKGLIASLASLAVPLAIGGGLIALAKSEFGRLEEALDGVDEANRDFEESSRRLAKVMRDKVAKAAEEVAKALRDKLAKEAAEAARSAAFLETQILKTGDALRTLFEETRTPIEKVREEIEALLTLQAKAEEVGFLQPDGELVDAFIRKLKELRTELGLLELQQKKGAFVLDPLEAPGLLTPEIFSKQAQEIREALQSIFEETRTPLERLNAEIEELFTVRERAIGLGLFDEEDFEAFSRKLKELRTEQGKLLGGDRERIALSTSGLEARAAQLGVGFGAPNVGAGGGAIKDVPTGQNQKDANKKTDTTNKLLEQVVANTAEGGVTFA